MKKIYISILSIILLGVVFGTVTFAWISLNERSNVDNLSLSAMGDDDDLLEVSLDGINYSNSISKEQLGLVIGNPRLSDVTSQDGKTFLAGGPSGTSQASRNRNYISFDVYFRSTERSRNVYLVDNVTRHDATFEEPPKEGTYVLSKGVMWSPLVSFRNGPNASDIVGTNNISKYYVSDGMRISSVEMVNENNPLDQRNQSDLKSFIFDTSEDETRGFGVDFGAKDYYERVIKTSITPPNTPVTIYELTGTTGRSYATNENSFITSLVSSNDGYYYGKARISIWIEGWDADAFDSVLGDTVKIALAFKVLRPAR